MTLLVPLPPPNHHWVPSTMLVSGGKTDIEIEHQSIQDMRIQVKGGNTPVGEPSQKLAKINMGAMQADFLSQGQSWTSMSSLCLDVIIPACINLRDILSRDVENVAKILSELESSTDGDQSGRGHEVKDPVRRVTFSTDEGPSPPGRIPTIIVTSAPFHEPDVSYLTPFQNRGFGNCLVVPGHPAWNNTFPPCAASPHLLLHSIPVKWVWKEGHWEAVLPSLEEQLARGLFSRPLPLRHPDTEVNTL